MPMTDKELEQLVETQLLLHKAEIVKALKAFQASPNARTFRDAENIPDALVGQSIDAIVGTVLGRTAAESHVAMPEKKTGLAVAASNPEYS